MVEWIVPQINRKNAPSPARERALFRFF